MNGSLVQRNFISLLAVCTATCGQCANSPPPTVEETYLYSLIELPDDYLRVAWIPSTRYGSDNRWLPTQDDPYVVYATIEFKSRTIYPADSPSRTRTMSWPTSAAEAILPKDVLAQGVPAPYGLEFTGVVLEPPIVARRRPWDVSAVLVGNVALLAIE